MNTVTEESKSGAIKILAIIGLIGLIILAVWLAIQAVRVLPGAFANLASMATGIQHNVPATELTVESETEVVNSGESFTITWNNVRRDGEYAFSYTCTEGVAVSIGNEFVPCETSYALLEDGTSLSLQVLSEKRRYEDLEYTVTFTGADDTFLAGNGTITVVNPEIPVGGEVLGETTDDEEEPTPAEEEPEEEEENPVPEEPEVTYHEYTYIPQSDPNGYTDLEVKLLGVGRVSGNTFIPQTSVDNDREAAIQIQVKNIGTKTSNDWDLAIDLPNGSELELDNQDGLKPNERAVLTITFEPDDDETGIESFDGEVSLSGDRNTSNNDFSGTIRFTN